MIIFTNDLNTCHFAEETDIDYYCFDINEQSFENSIN
jgi:hypothetical protein